MQTTMELTTDSDTDANGFETTPTSIGDPTTKDGESIWTEVSIGHI